MDEMVLATQKWLNKTYGNDSRFVHVEEDGATGWGTIYGLTRAFQIRIGASVDGQFGPGTKKAMKAIFENGIVQQKDGAESKDRVYAIIQGALWCKGYSTGSGAITEHFYSGTGEGIKELKSDMGISSSSSTVTPDIMEALLSMNQYVLVSKGSSTIRSIQRALNGSYQAYIGLIPCDGIYGREMNDALIKVLQAIEGYSPEEATGTFGEGTKSKCPSLPDPTKPEATKLLKYALCCNGYPIADLTGNWTTITTNQVKAFQQEYCLSVDGEVGVNTWMALLLSCGNRDRSAKGCDCATVLDANKAKALYNAGYRYVGRYLTGGIGSGSTFRSKAMTKIELKAIFDAGLKVFAIYQDNDPVVNYYTEIQGTVDAANAVSAARNLGIPADSFIYFAVDCDMMDYEVTSNALPYFRGIRKGMRAAHNLYKIGIYGSRNICTRVSEQNLAKSSFVADMSTGYSGNMGFPIPKNWAFDQFAEYVFTGAAAIFDLDKDAYSGRYSGFGSLSNYPDDFRPVPNDELLLDRTEYLLAKLGINMAWNYTIGGGPKVVVDVPGLKVSYEAVAGAINQSIPNAGQVTIKNNQIVQGELANITGKFDNLSESVKGFISNDGTLSILSVFSTEIGNGKILFGYRLNGNKLTASFAIEEQLWDTDNGIEKLTLYITIELTNNGSYQSQFTTLRQAVNSQTAEVRQANCALVLGAIAFTSIVVGGIAAGAGAVTALSESVINVLAGLAIV